MWVVHIFKLQMITEFNILAFAIIYFFAVVDDDVVVVDYVV